MTFLDNAADDESIRIVEGYHTNQAEAKDERTAGDTRETWHDVQVRYAMKGANNYYTEADLTDVAYSSLPSLYDLAEYYRAKYNVLHVDAKLAQDNATRRVYVGMSDVLAIELTVTENKPDASAQEDERRSKFRHPAGSKLADGETLANRPRLRGPMADEQYTNVMGLDT